MLSIVQGAKWVNCGCLPQDLARPIKGARVSFSRVHHRSVRHFSEAELGSHLNYKTNSFAIDKLAGSIRLRPLSVAKQRYSHVLAARPTACVFSRPAQTLSSPS